LAWEIVDVDEQQIESLNVARPHNAPTCTQTNQDHNASSTSSAKLKSKQEIREDSPHHSSEASVEYASSSSDERSSDNDSEDTDLSADMLSEEEQGSDVAVSANGSEESS